MKQFLLYSPLSLLLRNIFTILCFILKQFREFIKKGTEELINMLDNDDLEFSRNAK